MKRSVPWAQNSTSSESSSSDPEEDGSGGKITNKKAAEPGTKKRNVLDYDALSRHGYKGGLSVLRVPPPKAAGKQDWSWSTGRREPTDADTGEEPYEQRERTRAAANAAGINGPPAPSTSPAADADRKERKNLSFSQKEKRKRDLGQASRGKNYVEEEKRLLRDSGVYSGFDS